MAKLADHPPAYCCACYQSSPDLRYVDYEAAYDGPTIPGSPANIPVDDLILCEKCLLEAFSLLDPQEHVKENDALRGRIEALEDEIRSKDRSIRGLNTAATQLAEHPIELQGGRQTRTDMDAHTRMALELSEAKAELRRYRRAAQRKKERKAEKAVA